MTTTTKIDIAGELDLIEDWWAGAAADRPYLGEKPFRIAGTVHDQPHLPGVDNPYWEILRHYPSIDDGWDGITPNWCLPGTLLHRNDLTRLFAWAIPTPGDITWMTEVLNGQPVVEAAAGSGYWAWQLAQAGADVAAYDPRDPAESDGFVAGVQYHPLRAADAVTAAQAHPDRALLLSWPAYGASFAAAALDAYRGDLVIYAGEPAGGCCADDDFFTQLDTHWLEVGSSPHHRTWWGIHCRLTAYRRAAT